MELGIAFIVGWIGGAILVGAFAARRGRSGFGWFFFGAFLSPLIAWVFVALLPDLKAAAAATEAIADTTHRRCPQCAEFIRREALRCKHCGAEVAPAPYVDPREQRPEKPHSSEGARRAGRAVGRLFARNKKAA